MPADRISFAGLFALAVFLATDAVAQDGRRALEARIAELALNTDPRPPSDNPLATTFDKRREMHLVDCILTVTSTPVWLIPPRPETEMTLDLARAHLAENPERPGTAFGYLDGTAMFTILVDPAYPGTLRRRIVDTATLETWQRSLSEGEMGAPEPVPGVNFFMAGQTDDTVVAELTRAIEEYRENYCLPQS